MTHSEKAIELFAGGCNCAQATYVVFFDVTGMDEETAIKVSSAFGGGMGRMRSVCGSCTGAYMVLGMLYGEGADKDYETKKRLYSLVQDFTQRFKAINNTIICAELLEGLKTDTRPVPTPRSAEFLKVRPCARFVSDACNILDEMIEENK